MSGVTADSEKPSGTRHIWCRPRVGHPLLFVRFCAKSSLAMRQQLDHLAQGSFVERGINVLG